MKHLITSLLLLSLIGCGTLPSTRTKTTEFKSFSFDKQQSASSNTPRPTVALEDIALYENQMPPGILKDGDILKVQEGYEDKIEVLGVTTVALKASYFSSPFPFSMSTQRYYLADEDITATHKYCNAMSWQAGVFVLLAWIPNYLGPWNYPCYTIETHGQETDEDIEYRTKAIHKEMRKSAQQLGGNAVVGMNIGGISLVSDSGAVVANSNAWTGYGIVVRFK
ncbi:MAG: hypothetical protein H7A08_04480 [Oceanospirillaceae bacterium]|nr:hypothetical protein [Oceanospirillaceae bacterium]